MRDLKEQIDQLAGLMDEFKLSEATLNLSGFQVTFKRPTKAVPAAIPNDAVSDQYSEEDYDSDTEPVAASPKGNPVSSPMAGIFFVTSSPTSPPFVKVGDVITAGQTIGLIEAMKVYNEIPSPFSGEVLEIVAESGALVQPGDVLVRIG